MSIHSGRDRYGYFYQWSNKSQRHIKWTKYYYSPDNKKSQANANYKARKQGLTSKYQRLVEKKCVRSHFF